MSNSNASPLYNETQKRVLVIIPYLSAPFSILGSASIIYGLIVDKEENLKKPFGRLVHSLSTMDFIYSLSLVVLGSWSVHKGSQLAYGAAGTVTTCDIAGFFYHLWRGGRLFHGLPHRVSLACGSIPLERL